MVEITAMNLLYLHGQCWAGQLIDVDIEEIIEVISVKSTEQHH